MRAKLSLVLPALFMFFAAVPAAVRAANAPDYFELTDAPTITVDWSKGNTQAVTLHGNHTLVFTNGQKGGREGLRFFV